MSVQQTDCKGTNFECTTAGVVIFLRPEATATTVGTPTPIVNLTTGVGG
jgi:hypothetical protein